MHTLPEFFGAAKTTVASVVIVGGSGITIHLCRLLEEQKIHVKIIEQDEAKCEKIAKLSPMQPS